jgi:NTE family protein
MRAYAICDGGGVKGAALAGCLCAAQQQGIHFVGYGGTSAGSIVALLAAVGYDGPALQRILVDELDLKSLLEDDGKQLGELRSVIAKVASDLQSGSKWQKFCAINFQLPRLAKRFETTLGIYAGEKLKDFLLEKIKGKLPSLRDHADITFQHLQNAGCVPVKIVASDISLRKPAVFALEQTDYGASVIEAVRASTCYPFAFQPLLKNGRRLVDGGLSSNLPAFLFEEEFRQTRIPALAFDLIAPPGGTPAIYHVGHYVSDLLATALEASDQLLRRVLHGVHHVPIETPQGIETLDFELSPGDRKRLFDAGYKSTGEFLAGFAPLQRAKMAGDQLQRRLRVEYGPEQYFTPVLYALAKDIERRTSAKNVRAAIMLPTGRAESTRIVVYHYNMDGDSDADLELPEDAGCSGQSWRNRAVAFADLEEAAQDPSPWGMTREQHAKVPSNRKSMISVPVHRELQPTEQTPPAPVATLGLDSTTPLDRTGWIEDTARGPVAHPDVVRIMMTWAYIVYRLLP